MKNSIVCDLPIQFSQEQNFQLNEVKPQLAKAFVEVTPSTGLIGLKTTDGSTFTFFVPFNCKNPIQHITEKFGWVFETDFVFVWFAPKPTAETYCLYLGSEWN